MNIKCAFGIHDWKGCICSKCGKIRELDHDWLHNCEKCAKCGKARPDGHEWSGCKCLICDKRRNESHDWTADPGKCAKCGAKRTIPSKPKKSKVSVVESRRKGSIATSLAKTCGHPDPHWGGGACSVCGTLWCADCLDPKGPERRQRLDHLSSTTGAFVLDGHSAWNDQLKAFCPRCKSWTVTDQ
jgi:hypothetical protein